MSGASTLAGATGEMTNFWMGQLFWWYLNKKWGYTMFFRWGVKYAWVNAGVIGITLLAVLAYDDADLITWAASTAGFIYGFKGFWENRQWILEYIEVTEEIKADEYYYEDEYYFEDEYYND